MRFVAIKLKQVIFRLLSESGVYDLTAELSGRFTFALNPNIIYNFVGSNDLLCPDLLSIS